MDSFCAVQPEGFMLARNGEIASTTYECPKDLVQIRLRRQKLQLTEGQEAAFSKYPEN